MWRASSLEMRRVRLFVGVFMRGRRGGCQSFRAEKFSAARLMHEQMSVISR
jgi:hypothetical protein